MRRTRIGLSAVAMVVLMMAAACGGSDDGDDASGAEVRPFAEVQDGELVFEPDPADPSQAIFRVETAEPMICAIVWGDDESFGRFNNSLSMNGTGITDHDVVLPDVEAGVTYSYIIQGTTADGTLYRSDVDTFRIDAADAAATATSVPAFAAGEDLALDATVTGVSSEFSDTFGAEAAIDGDTETEWATSGDGDDGSITVDLGARQSIAGVEFVTRSMADGSSITSTYTVTIDGGQPLGPFPAGTPAEARPAQLDDAGRELRFDIESSSGGNVGAIEIRIYAPSAG